MVDKGFVCFVFVFLFTDEGIKENKIRNEVSEISLDKKENQN